MPACQASYSHSDYNQGSHKRPYYAGPVHRYVCGRTIQLAAERAKNGVMNGLNVLVVFACLPAQLNCAAAVLQLPTRSVQL